MKRASKKIAASLVALIGGAACGNSGTPASATHPPKVFAVIATASSPSGLPRCMSALQGDTVMVSSPLSLWYCGNGGEWEQIVCNTSLAGDVAYASASSALWACVGGAWTRIALPDAGPAGPQGPQGPTGDAGPAGATGPQGAVGPQGAQGDAGAVSIVVQLALPVGNATCAYGGTEIESGVDRNGDGQLTGGEITSYSYVCNGAPGEAGAQGPAGPQGPPGATGSQGATGPGGATGPQGAPGSQVQVTAEPPGSNCSAGGERIDVGTVVDGGFEAQQTTYVCNGTGLEAGSADANAGLEAGNVDATTDSAPDAGPAADAGLVEASADDGGSAVPADGGTDGIAPLACFDAVAIGSPYSAADACRFSAIPVASMPTLYTSGFRAAVDPAYFAGGSQSLSGGASAGCGECVEVTGPSGTATFMVSDENPTATSSEVDLDKTQSLSVLSPVINVTGVSVRPVACPFADTLKLYVGAGSTNLFAAITPFAGRVGVRALEIRGAGAGVSSDNPWVTLTRSNANAFQATAAEDFRNGGTGVEIRVTSSEAEVLVPGVVFSLAAGSVVDLGTQFQLAPGAAPTCTWMDPGNVFVGGFGGVNGNEPPLWQDASFSVTGETLGDPSALTPAGNQSITVTSMSGFGALNFFNSIGVNRASGGTVTFWAKSAATGAGTTLQVLVEGTSSEGGSFACTLGKVNVSPTNSWMSFAVPITGCAGAASANITQLMIQNDSSNTTPALAVGDIRM